MGKGINRYQNAQSSKKEMVDEPQFVSCRIPPHDVKRRLGHMFFGRVLDSTAPFLVDVPVENEYLAWGERSSLLYDGVSFTVPAGNKLAVVGPSGSSGHDTLGPGTHSGSLSQPVRVRTKPPMG